jgi:hypothetical protein
LRKFVNGKFFENILTLAVIANTIIMALDGLFDEASETTAKLQDFNYSFTILFTIEMGLKVIALTPRGLSIKFK